MIKCPKCGKEFETAVKFCDECGTRITVSPTNPVPSDNYAKYTDKQIHQYKFIFFVLALIFAVAAFSVINISMVLFLSALILTGFCFFSSYQYEKAEYNRRAYRMKQNQRSAPVHSEPTTEEKNEPPTIADRDANFKSIRKSEFEKELNSISAVNINIGGEKTKKRLASEMPQVNFASITKSTNVEKLFPFVIIDTETTGIKLSGNDIIEVSAIKFEKGFTPVSFFSTLVNIKKELPEEITEITGITQEMIVGKPYFYEIRDAFNDYIKGCNIVGHNLLFDIKFLYVNGIDFPQKTFRYFDTLEISKKILKAARRDSHTLTGYSFDTDFDVLNYKLETLCDYYNIYRDNAHRSLSDCYATFKVFTELLNEKDLI